MLVLMIHKLMLIHTLELADTNWEATDYNWAAATVSSLLGGLLVSDTFTEAYNPIL